MSKPEGSPIAGDEYVSVIVLVNNNMDFIRHAVLQDIQGNNIGRYKVDDENRLITFNRNQDFKQLARQILNLS